MSEQCVGPVLAVTCKGKEAHLYLRDLARAVAKATRDKKGKKYWVKEPCVAFEDQWVTPNSFVRDICGLRDSRPAWKVAVYHNGVTMKKLFDDGTVTLKPLACRCGKGLCREHKTAALKKTDLKSKTKKKPGKEVVEISTVFVCSVCDATFRTKKNFETHKKFAHLPALLPTAPNPGRWRNYNVAYANSTSTSSTPTNSTPSSSTPTNSTPSSSTPNSSEHTWSSGSSVQSKSTNNRWSNNAHINISRKSEVRLTRLPELQATAKEIITPKWKELSSSRPDSASSPAPCKRARVTEVTSTTRDLTPEPPAAKRVQRAKPVAEAATGTNNNPIVTPKAATPNARAKRLMIAANAFSGCSTEALLAELVERKACFACTCGIVYTDRALFYLHKGMHDQNDPKKCTFCGYMSENNYDFSSHFLEHTNPEKDDDE